MEAGDPDSFVMSEAPSSDESDCDHYHEHDDAALTEEWARDLLADIGVIDPHEVNMCT